MKTRRSVRALAAASAIGALALTSAPANAADIYRMEGIVPGSTAGTFCLAFVQTVEKSSGLKLQMSTGKPVTKAVLLGAQGKADLFLSTPGINHFMQNQIAMYKKVKDAPALSKKVRSILNFPLGAYHYIVYESSGIESFADVKGKKLFLGPPGGAAPRLSSAVIEAAVGLKPKADYTMMRFDWTAGRTAFADRQMDLFGFPTAAPSANVVEYAASEKLRFLGIPDDKLDHPKIKGVLKLPGRTLTKLDPKMYAPNIVNTEPVNTIQGWIGLAVGSHVPEEAVYKMTKAFWENLDTVHKMAAWMPNTVTKENAFIEMNAPLHPGAYRYYKEAGWKVPESVIPKQ